MTQTIDPNSIVEAIARCLPPGTSPLPLHEPVFRGREWAYVKECLDSGWVSTAGPFVDRFERELERTTGARHAVAAVNGTAALHLALLLAGAGRDDEVIVPSLTFVATANAVTYCGAVPHFADCDEKTMGIDPSKLAGYLEDAAEVRGEECFNRRTGRRIAAVAPVHVFGHPVDLDPLADLCSRFRVKLVEDAAESLGSLYKGKHTGTLGLAAALSFNGNKIVTAGGGGAILTNDGEIARRAKHLSTTARVPGEWEFRHDETGYNYRLPNLNAALGLAQLEQLPGFLESKRALARKYLTAFEGVRGARIFREQEHVRSNCWLNVLVLDDAGLTREILERTHRRGILTRPCWSLLHRLPMYRGCPRMDLTVAEGLEGRIVCLPSSAGLEGTDAG